MIRSIVRSAVVLLGAVALVGGLVGPGRAAADEGGPASAPAFRVAGFETYDDDDGRRRYRCYDRYSYDGYGYYGYYRSYDDDGYYRSYDDDGRYRDRCRRYYDDDRYYDDRHYYRGDRDGDHDGDRDFPDRRRGRNHDDD